MMWKILTISNFSFFLEVIKMVDCPINQNSANCMKEKCRFWMERKNVYSNCCFVIMAEALYRLSCSCGQT